MLKLNRTEVVRFKREKDALQHKLSQFYNIIGELAVME